MGFVAEIRKQEGKHDTIHLGGDRVHIFIRIVQVKDKGPMYVANVSLCKVASVKWATKDDWEKVATWWITPDQWLELEETLRGI